jgi:hypothetical protein
MPKTPRSWFVATAAKWCPHLVEERIPYVTLEDRVILSIALKDKSLSNYPSTLTFILFPKKKDLSYWFGGDVAYFPLLSNLALLWFHLDSVTNILTLFHFVSLYGRQDAVQADFVSDQWKNGKACRKSP